MNMQWVNTMAVTEDSFLAAYVEAYPMHKCHRALDEWNDLHTNHVWADEIDEDPS